MKKIILATIIALGLGTNVSADTIVTVTKSVPNYSTSTVRTPHTTSYQERVTSRVQCGYTYQENRNYNSGIGLDTVVGMGIGSLIGSAFGGGNGKTLATGVGAIVGGSVANNGRSSSSSYTKVPKYCNDSHYVTKYRTTYTYENVNTIIGYTNYFTYKGAEYVKSSDTPLSSILITN